MNLRILKFLGLPVVLGILGLAPAYAVGVQYTTTGTFTGCIGQWNCSSNTLTGPNGLNITYTGVTQGFPNLNVPPTSNAAFGLFTVSGEQPGFTDNPPITINFELDVAQTLPSGGTETITDKITGTIAVGNSTASVVFDGGSGAGGTPTPSVNPITGGLALKFSIGNVTYWVNKSTGLVAPTCAADPCTSTKPGVSTIEGAISATATPEPTFYSLTGIGLVSLVGMAIRRRRNSSV